MDKPSILLAEDDPNLGSILHEYLQLKQFDVSLFTDGEQAWEAFRAASFDLCILDVMMPRKDGFTLARSIRGIDTRTPIIFLTARSMKEDKLEGFGIGADDYITKPFSIEELLMRIQAVLRRTNRHTETRHEEQHYTIGSFHYDVENRLLSIDGEERRISAKEAQLLAMLCADKNRIVKREQALKHIWGEENYFNARSMDVYITKLRKHLKDDPSVRISNVHGIGYKLEDG